MRPNLTLYWVGVSSATSRRNAREANEQSMATAIDPVCGMQVETEGAQLTFEYGGTTYYFCGRGCLLEFREDPERYLSADHTPSM